MKMRQRVFALVSTILVAVSAACVQAPDQQNGGAKNGEADGKIRIGFSMATLKEERWTKDKESFEAHCKKMQVECSVKVANNNADKQANDADNLLTQGIDVLVIAPHDATQSASIVEKAKKQGVPVISYDRLINSDKIDLYISHQVPVIGRVMAEYAIKKKPTGNYVLVYGDATDNNAVIMKKEQLAVLQPYIDRGDIKIVAGQNAKDWSANEALKIVENALTQNSDKIDAVIASNDGTAGGAISALETKNLAGKVVVTGQDAEKAALQRIAEGKQSMTVYKPIIPLANAAVEAAIKLARKEKIESTPFMNDEIKKEINAILLEIIVVDRDNLLSTVIKDGWATFDEVFKNVPEMQRPNKEG